MSKKEPVTLNGILRDSAGREATCSVNAMKVSLPGSDAVAFTDYEIGGVARTTGSTRSVPYDPGTGGKAVSFSSSSGSSSGRSGSTSAGSFSSSGSSSSWSGSPPKDFLADGNYELLVNGKTIPLVRRNGNWLSR